MAGPSGAAIFSITEGAHWALQVTARPSAAKRSRWIARAAATRAATSADGSAGAGRIRSAAVTAGTSMRMSMRSSSGPESRAW